MPSLWITSYLEAAAGVELDDEDELDLSELPDDEPLSELPEELLDLSDDFVSPAGLLDDESEDDELDESPLELEELLALELFDASRLSLR